MLALINPLLIALGIGCVIAVLAYLAGRMVRRPSASRQDVVAVGEQAAHPLPDMEHEKPLNYSIWWQNQ